MTGWRVGFLLMSDPNYIKEMAKLNEAYAKALAPLEKAHSINPEEPITVELLKSLYFRLRDESPEMMDNFNKYNELFKSMQQ